VSDDNDLSSIAEVIQQPQRPCKQLQQLQPFFVRRCAADILKPQLWQLDERRDNEKLPVGLHLIIFNRPVRLVLREIMHPGISLCNLKSSSIFIMPGIGVIRRVMSASTAMKADQVVHHKSGF
jgi:hypothetical protein